MSSAWRIDSVKAFFNLPYGWAPKYLCKSILGDMLWSHRKGVAVWEFAFFSHYSLCSIVLSTCLAAREDLPAPVLRAHPCNLAVSGEKMLMQSWSPRRLLKRLALPMLWIERTKINGVFRRAARIALGFFSVCYISILLLLNRSVLYFAITSACCLTFQCPRTCFLFQMCTVCFLWVADFQLI